VAVGSPPTVRRRQLGRELRRLREQAGLNADEVAKMLRCSTSRISRIETAQIRIAPGTVHEILDALHVVGPSRDRLVLMAREAEHLPWSHAYSDTLSRPVTTYYSLESEAAWLKAFESTVIHGLLQTDEYVRAVTKHWDHDPSFIDSMIASRRRRRALLTREEPLTLNVVFDEAVLRRQVGGHRVMKAQLQWLADCAQLPNVHLQVIAFEAGMHSGPGGSFGILGFADPDEPSVVYIENANDESILDRRSVVAAYEGTFDRLRAEALDSSETLALIRDQLSRYDNVR
jgi:transcriptional regulator with XRE-family HTH domain